MGIEQFFGVTTVNSLFGILVGLICTFVYLFYRAIGQRDKARDDLLQFANKGDFFTKKQYMRPDEYEFYKKLQNIIGPDYYLFPQVHLSSIIDIKNNFKDHDNLYFLLGNKSVDYVVLNKLMFPIMVIELNGKSHFWNNRKNRDELVKSLVTKIGINYLPIDKDNMNLEKIEQEIKSKLVS